MATELEGLGQDLDDPLWSAKVLVEQPELIVQVHRRYIDAGADVITTATYQASFEGFAERGIDREQATQLMRLGNELAQEACVAASHSGRPRALVAASAGSYGAFLADGSEYRGNYGKGVGELADFHGARLEVLEQGADLIAFETVPSATEAEAIAQVLSDREGPPAWVAFSCKDDKHVCDGTPLRDAAARLAGSPRVEAVGINCTPPPLIEALLEELSPAKLKLAYPNSGEAYAPDRHGWSGHRHGSAELTATAHRWLAAGAQVIGGCCRTTPELVRALAALRDANARPTS